MRLQEIMTPSPATAGAGDSIHSAAIKMAEGDIGCLPIVDHEEVIGVVTDRDIAIRAVAQGLNTDTVPVRDVMSKPVERVSVSADIEDVVQRMKEKQVRRLVVVNDAGESQGVISLGDIAQHCGDETSARVLERVSQ